MCKFLLIVCLLVLSTPSISDVPSGLKAIQKEGHYYYRINRRTQTGIYQRGEVIVGNVYHVLPKNAPGSCSHEVAIKIKMIRERMPHLEPMVAIYSMKTPAGYFTHTVVVIEKPEGGYFVLNNRNMWVSEFDDLAGFRNLRLLTYENAYARYNK